MHSSGHVQHCGAPRVGKISFRAASALDISTLDEMDEQISGNSNASIERNPHNGQSLLWEEIVQVLSGMRVLDGSPQQCLLHF
jgi:hypothetical protein